MAATGGKTSLSGIGEVSRILVATFAEDCGPCRRFRDEQLPKLRAKMAELGMKMEEVVVPSKSGNYPKNIPKSHMEKVSGFPSFIVYPFKAWTEAKKSPLTYTLSGQSYEGERGPEYWITISSWATSFNGEKAKSSETTYLPTGKGEYYNKCDQLRYKGPPVAIKR